MSDNYNRDVDAEHVPPEVVPDAHDADGTLGQVAGTGSGAVAGGLLGAAAGGPVGAVIGAVAGGVLGSAAGAMNDLSFAVNTNLALNLDGLNLNLANASFWRTPNGPVEPTPPLETDCGACRLCIDACPTGALDEPGTLDATRCLSYWTQSPDPIPEPYRAELGTQVYGCDICQDVCPWNRGVEKRRALILSRLGLTCPGTAYMRLSLALGGVLVRQIVAASELAREHVRVSAR